MEVRMKNAQLRIVATQFVMNADLVCGKEYAFLPKKKYIINKRNLQ